MKVIFLDHFGVMCLANKHGRTHNQDDFPRLDEMRIHGNFDNFDSDAIIILNSILKETGSEIVVSSDWKNWCSLERMCDFYLSQGIIKKPISFIESNHINSSIKEQRSLDILDFLNNNRSITNWVAIDDMYLSNLTNFIWVSKTDEGITQWGIKDRMLSYLK